MINFVMNCLFAVSARLKGKSKMSAAEGHPDSPARGSIPLGWRVWILHTYFLAKCWKINVRNLETPRVWVVHSVTSGGSILRIGVLRNMLQSRAVAQRAAAPSPTRQLRALQHVCHTLRKTSFLRNAFTISLRL